MGLPVGSLALTSIYAIAAILAIGPTSSKPDLRSCGESRFAMQAQPHGLLQSSDQRKEVVLISSHMLQGTLEVQGR